MNVEDHEQAMDYQWRLSDHLLKGDLFDGRSEARYEETDTDAATLAVKDAWWGLGGAESAVTEEEA